MTNNTKIHWENIYGTKKSDEVSWHQENPKTSLSLILSTNPRKSSSVIDIGGGDSSLVDKLLEMGFTDITVLDISSKALKRAQDRLKEKAKNVDWICADIRDLQSDKRFDIWHDRALLHFITSEVDIKKYVQLTRKYLKPEGYLIISAFSDKGPKKCSDLDIRQYTENSMRKLFLDGFEYVTSLEEKHLTPWGATQNFIYCLFKKTKEGK